MISYIKGNILKKFIRGKDHVVDILTSGGVGYRVNFTEGAYSELSPSENGEIEVFCSHHIRENAQILFGFASEVERDMFEMLITVSGVGPKSAVAILSFYRTDELSRIIFNKDDKLLSKVPGLGAKSAQKVIIELQNKILASFEDDGLGERKMDGNMELITELEDALKSLGFRGKELEIMVRNGSEMLKSQSDIKVEQLISNVLKK